MIARIILLVLFLGATSVETVVGQMVRSPELRLQYRRAEQAWQRGTSLLEAKTRLDRVIDGIPTDGEALRLRARVLLAMDRTDEALLDAREAVRLLPDDGEAHLVLCDAARRSGDIALAESALDKAADRITTGADLHVRLSQSALDLKQPERAESFARISLALDEEQPATHLQLARVFATTGSFRNAVTVLIRGFENGTLEPVFIHNDPILAPLAEDPLLAPWVSQ